VRAVIAEPLLSLAAPIDTLTTDPDNANRGDVAAIRKSLNVFGQRKPVVARRTGRDADGRPTGFVTAGNHTLLAAIELGWDHIATVFLDDDATTAKAYALADNRTGELSTWDDEQLAETMRELTADDFDLSSLGWTGDQLAALLASGPYAVDPADAAIDDGDVPEPPAVPFSALGDLWQLGPHRLLCGDATDPAAHALLLDGLRPDLLLMDPPYGMRLDTDYSTIRGALGSIGRGNGTVGNKYPPVIGDHEDYDPRPVLDMYTAVGEQFWWGADYYAERIPDRVSGSWVVWDKRKDSQAEAIGSEFELCWSRGRHKRRMLRHEWFGFLSSESPTEARNRVHPTQKPVALYRDILDQWGTPGGVVLDAYGGSGPTVIACDRVGMTALVMELSPAYADVICRRYQEHSGVLPVLASTGVAHDFT
jgi:hypothetical protein